MPSHLHVVPERFLFLWAKVLLLLPMTLHAADGWGNGEGVPPPKKVHRRLSQQLRFDRTGSSRKRVRPCLAKNPDLNPPLALHYQIVAPCCWSSVPMLLCLCLVHLVARFVPKGEEGVASSPGLEIISPDDIVETPPSAAPKKRLKARKLVAAVAAATAAESVPAVTLPVAAMSEQEDEGQDGEMEEGHTVRRHGETRGKAPGEVPGRAEGERREENDETGEIEEEAEEEADLESATLTDTDTEEAAPAPQAAEEDRRHRQSRQDRQEERQRDAPAEGARENASAPPPPVGKPSEEERAAASTSGTASGRPTASGDRGRGGGSSAATRSSSHLRGGVAAPQPPVLSGPESLQVNTAVASPVAAAAAVCVEVAY